MSKPTRGEKFSEFGTLAGMPLYLWLYPSGTLILVLEEIGPRGGDYTRRIPIGNREVATWLRDALNDWLVEEATDDLSE